MDVDGTLTDGKIYMGQDGEMCKAFNIKDGCGIHDKLIPSGIVPVIITGRKSDIVLNRCNELGITEIYQGVSDKAGKMKEICTDLSVVAYIGDDINDLESMEAVKTSGGLWAVLMIQQMKLYQLTILFHLKTVEMVQSESLLNIF